MNKSFGCYLALSFLLSFGPLNLAGAEAPGAADPDLSISVLVSNYAQLPEGTLAGAVEEAAKIFRQAGVETVWLYCGPSSATPLDDPGCQQQLSPTVVFMRILSGSMTEGFGLRHNTCGVAAPEWPVFSWDVAAPSPNGGFGSYAFIFFDCIREMADTLGARAETILSHMLAHEMGHLLLGPGSHSRKGIMHDDWDREQAQSASWGRLHFTPRQADKMQAEVQKRTLAGQVAQNR